MGWYKQRCPECGGALFDAEERGWVDCLLCGRSFPTVRVVAREADLPATIAGARKSLAPRAEPERRVEPAARRAA